MKKTIIALFALGTTAMGVTLEDGEAFTSSSYTAPTTWTTGGLSVTLLLDVDQFAALFENATSSARPVFVSMSGNSTANHIIGLAAHEENRIVGSDLVVAGGTYNNQYSLTSTGGVGSDSIASIDWDKVTAAALTMALETSSQGTYFSLTVLNKDNTYTSMYAGLSGLRWSAMGDITSISVDKNVVTQAYAFDGHITNTSAYALNEAAIAASLSIPEPTTATLSLLALAGLAARRRRR